jgi:hypothetical protein
VTLWERARLIASLRSHGFSNSSKLVPLAPELLCMEYCIAEIPRATKSKRNWRQVEELVEHRGAEQ